MGDNGLTEAQKRILAYKEDNLTTGNEILAILSKADPDKPFEYPVEVKQRIRRINNNLSSIASLAGGRRTRNIMKALEMLERIFEDLQRMAGNDLNGQKQVIEYWLKYVDKVAVQFDDKGRPIDLGIEFDPATLKSKFHISLK